MVCGAANLESESRARGLERAGGSREDPIGRRTPATSLGDARPRMDDPACASAPHSRRCHRLSIVLGPLAAAAAPDCGEAGPHVIRVIFLGTAASRPTVGRNVTSLLIAREGELLMFDCGEGTQRQMMRYATGFTVNDVFFTHMHADHFLGIIGLLRTMGLQGRTEAMRLWGPIGAREILHEAVHLGVERVPFEIDIIELEQDAVLRRDGYDIIAYRTQHGICLLGFALIV